MTLTTTDRLTLWQETLAKLRWTPKHADRSATLALSKAQWLGLDKDQAIQQILELSLSGFFQANPHIPFEAWQTISDEIEGRAEGAELLLAL